MQRAALLGGAPPPQQQQSRGAYEFVDERERERMVAAEKDFYYTELAALADEVPQLLRVGGVANGELKFSISDPVQYLESLHDKAKRAVTLHAEEEHVEEMFKLVPNAVQAGLSNVFGIDATGYARSFRDEKAMRKFRPTLRRLAQQGYGASDPDPFKELVKLFGWHTALYVGKRMTQDDDATKRKEQVRERVEAASGPPAAAAPKRVPLKPAFDP